ncbi:MAG: DUF1376 domain-containing protein [Candidatus Sulfotelmatobacter sp.]
MANAWTAFYWRDYIADTGHLSLAQHGAYMLLMAHYYSTGNPLPADLDQLGRICRCLKHDDAQAVTDVLAQFFVRDGETYRHKRIDQELARHQRKAEEYAARAKKAANGRWPHHASSIPQALLEDTQPQPQPQPQNPSPVKDFDSDFVLEENATRARDEDEGIGKDVTKVIPDQPALNYARKICEELELPTVRANLEAFAGAHEALVKTGKSPAAAYAFLVARANEEKALGQPVKWTLWCLDGNFNLSAGATSGNAMRLVSPGVFDPTAEQCPEPNCRLTSGHQTWCPRWRASA